MRSESVESSLVRPVTGSYYGNVTQKETLLLGHKTLSKYFFRKWFTWCSFFLAE